MTTTNRAEGSMGKKTKHDLAFTTATNATMNRMSWAHHVATGAIANGVDADWLTENFASRMVVWFNAGESVGGAVDMLVFSWTASRPAVRAEQEMEHLKAFVRGGVR